MSEMPPASTRLSSFVDRIPPSTRKAGALAGLVIAGVLAGWIGRGLIAGQPDVPMMQVYKDWQLACPDRKEKDTHCSLAASIADPASGQSVGGIRIGYEVDKDKKASKVMIVSIVPGVSLEPGLGLRIGSNTKAYPYKTCFPSGCFVEIPYSDELDDQLSEASDTYVVVVGADNKPVQVPFSTKGFVEARKAFKTNEAKHSSWFWRLWL